MFSNTDYCLPITDNSRRRRAGLTLIEVLLAILILGIAMPPLIAAAGKCLSIAKKARHYETARELLARVELEHMIKRDKMDEASDSGSFDGDYAGYSWNRKADIIGKEEDGLWMVATTVRWSENGLENHETVVTYIYAPQQGLKESF